MLAVGAYQFYQAVLVLHIVCILFLGAGPFILFRRPYWRLIHLLAMGYTMIQNVWLPWLCPLTLLEQTLLTKSGLKTYDGGILGPLSGASYLSGDSPAMGSRAHDLPGIGYFFLYFIVPVKIEGYFGQGSLPGWLRQMRN